MTRQNRSSWQTAHKASSLAILELMRSSVVMKRAALVRLSDSEAASRTVPREAHPVGNTGITTLELANHG